MLFPKAGKLADLAYLRWLYTENPVGSVIGFNARVGGRLAAHYVCVPISLELAQHEQLQQASLRRCGQSYRVPHRRPRETQPAGAALQTSVPQAIVPTTCTSGTSLPDQILSDLVRFA